VEEQILAQEWPFKCDLVVLSDLLQALKGVPGLGHLSLQKLGIALEELGCRNAGQKRFPDGSKPRVWAVRNRDKWDQAKEKDYVSTYEAPGRYEDQQLANIGDY